MNYSCFLFISESAFPCFVSCLRKENTKSVFWFLIENALPKEGRKRLLSVKPGSVALQNGRFFFFFLSDQFVKLSCFCY